MINKIVSWKSHLWWSFRPEGATCAKFSCEHFGISSIQFNNLNPSSKIVYVKSPNLALLDHACQYATSIETTLCSKGINHQASQTPTFFLSCCFLLDILLEDCFLCLLFQHFSGSLELLSGRSKLYVSDNTVGFVYILGKVPIDTPLKGSQLIWFILRTIFFR